MRGTRGECRGCTVVAERFCRWVRVALRLDCRRGLRLDSEPKLVVVAYCCQIRSCSLLRGVCHASPCANLTQRQGGFYSKNTLLLLNHGTSLLSIAAQSHDIVYSVSVEGCISGETQGYVSITARSVSVKAHGVRLNQNTRLVLNHGTCLCIHFSKQKAAIMFILTLIACLVTATGSPAAFAHQQTSIW